MLQCEEIPYYTHIRLAHTNSSDMMVDTDHNPAVSNPGIYYHNPPVLQQQLQLSQQARPVSRKRKLDDYAPDDYAHESRQPARKCRALRVAYDQRLPDELLLLIFSHLDAAALSRASSAKRQLSCVN